MNPIATLKGLSCPHCRSEQLTVTGTKGALGAAIATGAAFGAIGNLVAGSDAAADRSTGPLQYKCASCGKKYESLPLIAPPEDVLAAPCTVTFTRMKSFVGAVVPQIAYINGIKLGAVKNGQSISFTTNNRYNVMFVTDQYGVAFKSEYRFEAQHGGSISVQFNRKFLDAYNAPLPGAPANPPITQQAPSMTPPSPAGKQTGFCTNCGNPLISEAAFCPNCGEKRASV
jgi:DNA-directed RNA polymerase subunit RPC12/RpoP